MKEKVDYKQAAKDSIKSLHVFLKNMWGVINQDEYVDNWHIEYLCDYLTSEFYKMTTDGTHNRNTIVNISPGSTKSTIFVVMFALWVWFHKPHFVIMTTSYGDPIIDLSILSKKIFNSDKYQYMFQGYFENKFGERIRLVKSTEAKWANNFGGQRIAVTTNGAATGKHCHILIRDDPQSQQNAWSDAYIKRCNNFNDKTLPTRKKDKINTPTFTIMQRLREDDTTGHELSKKGKTIHHIVIPAQIGGKIQPKPKALKKYYINGLMDPKRLSLEALATQKIDLGPHDFSGQFLQSPTTVGGGKIKESWWQTCKPEEVPPYLDVDLWIDGAYTKRTENDPTGLVPMAMDYDTHTLYILHAKSAHLEMPDLLKEVPSYASTFNLGNASAIYIEPKASGKSLRQLLNVTTEYSAIEIESHLVNEGKISCINTMSPKVHAGKILLVEGDWNEEVIHQISGFPAKHDEYVDLFGYACDLYFQPRPQKRQVRSF